SMQFVTPVNPNLICSICTLPLTRPVTAPCDHTFCLECISRHLESSSWCPLDRRHLLKEQLQPASKIICNMVDELLVYCEFKDKGCHWDGQRQFVNTHISDCLFRSVVCTIPGCAATVLFRDLEKHCESCEHRLTLCHRCHLEVKVKDLKEHESTCKPIMHECMFCKELFESKSLQQHSSVCTEYPVACQYHRFGCPWAGSRAIVANHLETCIFNQLQGFLSRYEQETNALREENKQLKQYIADTNHRMNEIAFEPIPPPVLDKLALDLQFLQSEMENVNANLQALAIKQDMSLMSESSRLREEMQLLRSTVSTMQIQLLNLSRKGTEQKRKNETFTKL
ncbi:hypothetical protein EDD86DRAFT_188639, partial [Gorgonomyces haynaldii]